MHHHSFRGVGLRYVLALTLPITGIALVLYTIVQLVGFQVRDRRTVSAAPAAAPSQPEHQTASPKK